jgi:hypothetical protein
MADTKVLLILDDVWDKSHEVVLNTVGAESKTLVTTRIKGLVSNAEQVEIGLPNTEDSVQLLLAAAGLGHLDSDSAPKEAVEVVGICGNLPLAVDIAGKFLYNLGLGAEDWSQVPTILRHELRNANDEDVSVEERLVTASLNSVPKRDRESVQAVFQLFATIEEDTHVPPAAMVIMLAAVTEGRALPELELRRLLQILIQRSLVLGTWERPQLHDIVREYAIGMCSEEELSRRQKFIVDAFRGARPAHPGGLDGFKKAPGLRGWVRHEFNECAEYVNRHIKWHVLGAIGSLSSVDDDTIAWLCDAPKDDIVDAVQQVLGVENLGQCLHMCEQDDARTFETVRLLEVWYDAKMRTEGFGFFKVEGVFGRLTRAWSRLVEKPQLLPQATWDYLRIAWSNLFLVVSASGFGGAEIWGGTQTSDVELQYHKDRLEDLLATTEVGKQNSEIWLDVIITPLLKAGDFDAADPMMLPRLRERVDEAPEAALRDGKLIFNTFRDCPRMLRLPEWSWVNWRGGKLTTLIVDLFEGWDPA